MGAEDSRKKLKKKKIKEGDSELRNSSFVQKEEKLAKVTEEKKKRFEGKIRRSEDEPNKIHLSNYKDESDNADGEKKKSKSSKKKRKNDRPAETETVEVDQSNEREDGLGPENNIFIGVSEPQTRISKKKKKRKTEKKVGRNEADDLNTETNDLNTEANDDSEQHRGKPKDLDRIVEKDHSFSITEDNSVEKKGQVEEEIYELSSGDDDCSKGMRKWVTDYYQSRPGLKVLQERIDEFITVYEEKKEQEKKEKEALAAEGGWTVVVHHKGRKKTTDSETGIAVGSVSQAAVMDNMANKKKKEVGLDFYRFQKREAKRNEIMELQSKFEQDKKRIQQLRAARKFRPY